MYRSQILKSHLVSNYTLSQLSKRYFLANRLRAEPAQLPTLRSGEKTTANIFEAYVAGLYYSPTSVSTPLTTLQDWLIPLFTPIAHWVLDQLKAETRRLISERSSGGVEEEGLDNLAIGSSARLNEYFIKYEGKKPEYLDSRAGSDMWKVLCMATKRNGETL
jgi:ribonuclease-3